MNRGRRNARVREQILTCRTPVFALSDNAFAVCTLSIVNCSLSIAVIADAMKAQHPLRSAARTPIDQNFCMMPMKP